MKCKLKLQWDNTMYLLEWLKVNSIKYWQGCGETGILQYCQWECKTVQPHWKRVWYFLFLFFFFFFLFFCLFRAAPEAYGGSQAGGLIGAAAVSLCHSHSKIQAVSVTYTTAHSNVRSLTYWVRPVIETASSWILVRFVDHWATTGTPDIFLKH